MDRCTGKVLKNKGLQTERLSAYGPKIDNAVISTTRLGMKKGENFVSSLLAL